MLPPVLCPCHRLSSRRPTLLSDSTSISAAAADSPALGPDAPSRPPPITPAFNDDVEAINENLPQPAALSLIGTISTHHLHKPADDEACGARQQMAEAVADTQRAHNVSKRTG